MNFYPQTGVNYPWIPVLSESFLVSGEYIYFHIIQKPLCISQKAFLSTCCGYCRDNRARVDPVATALDPLLMFPSCQGLH